MCVSWNEILSILNTLPSFLENKWVAKMILKKEDTYEDEEDYL